MMAQTNTIRTRPKINMPSANRSTRYILRARRVRSEKYERRHEARNSKASAAKKSSARVWLPRAVDTTRINPMTVKHTPTIAADAVNICMQTSSSRKTSGSFGDIWFIFLLAQRFAAQPQSAHSLLERSTARYAVCRLQRPDSLLHLKRALPVSDAVSASAK